MKRTLSVALIFLTVFMASNAHAIKVEGTFKATKSCPAYKSFKRGHNPGNIHSAPGRTYEVVEENKAEGPWALILIPEINSRRWVTKECGITTITSRSASTGGTSGSSPGCNIGNTYDSFVLALSWQAGFCEHYNYSGVKLECDNLNAGNISVTNLTIHGLWPNKNGCKKSYGDCTNDPLVLEGTTGRNF